MVYLKKEWYLQLHMGFFILQRGLLGVALKIFDEMGGVLKLQIIGNITYGFISVQQLSFHFPDNMFGNNLRSRFVKDLLTYSIEIL